MPTDTTTAVNISIILMIIRYFIPYGHLTYKRFEAVDRRKNHRPICQSGKYSQGRLNLTAV